MNFLGGTSMKHSPEEQKPWKQVDIDTLISINFDCIAVGYSNKGSVAFKHTVWHRNNKCLLYVLYLDPDWHMGLHQEFILGRPQNL